MDESNATKPQIKLASHRTTRGGQESVGWRCLTRLNYQLANKKPLYPVARYGRPLRTRGAYKTLRAHTIVPRKTSLYNYNWQNSRHAVKTAFPTRPNSCSSTSDTSDPRAPPFASLKNDQRVQPSRLCLLSAPRAKLLRRRYFLYLHRLPDVFDRAF